MAMLFLSALSIAGRALSRPVSRTACSLVFSGFSFPHGHAICTATRSWVQPSMVAKGSERELTSLGEMPDFRGPTRLRKAAYKQSKLIVPSSKITNAKKRAIKHATQTVDAYAQGLSVQLREQLAEFCRVLRGLPPFEAALSGLTLAALEREKGGRSLDDIITDFDAMRRTVVRVGKEAAAEVAQTGSAKEAKALSAEGIERIEEAFEEQSDALYALIRTVQSLRKLPRPTHEEPVLVLVGMPNVGKSSIVTATSTGDVIDGRSLPRSSPRAIWERATRTSHQGCSGCANRPQCVAARLAVTSRHPLVSAGTPEINDYPFTTRRLKMGHVEMVSGERYQVMDTPGVLSRPEEERNPMEGLTLAAVKHLPSAVVFVMDLSGTCGAQSAPHLQLAVGAAPNQLPPCPLLALAASSPLLALLIALA